MKDTDSECEIYINSLPNEGKNRLLAKWMLDYRWQDDPEIEVLLFLDDIKKDVYNANRIKKTFVDASVMARERVLSIFYPE